jgi:hypothetical protein
MESKDFMEAKDFMDAKDFEKVTIQKKYFCLLLLFFSKYISDFMLLDLLLDLF